jgi:hypothetical protein
MPSPLARLLDAIMRGERSKAEHRGPVAWHPACSRYHPRNAPCKLFLRKRKAKSGREVRRWCH